MIKIIIIGNGFDVAHDLKTRYSDFMEDLKTQIVEKIISPNKSYHFSKKGKVCEKNKKIIHKTNDNIEDPWIAAIEKDFDYELTHNPHSNSVYFKSLFQNKINSGFWSDLESHYFKTLYKNRTKPDLIKVINEEFEYLKTLLHEYLSKLESNIKDDDLENLVYSNLIFKTLNQRMNNQDYFEDYFFVSFNYTSKILNNYVSLLRNSILKNSIPTMDKKVFDPIYIHGELDILYENPIIFGYGDENSEKYRELEKLENPEFLINIKTFQYLRTQGYELVLGLLEYSRDTDPSYSKSPNPTTATKISEREDIHIQVIGHSLGLTDKALLKTIFEHPRVKKIEVCYHNDESNYFKKLYNLSRIFDDKSDMRRKIIPLKQTFRN